MTGGCRVLPAGIRMGRSWGTVRLMLAPDVIANAGLYALSQPDNVDVSDLVVRSEREA